MSEEAPRTKSLKRCCFEEKTSPYLFERFKDLNRVEFHKIRSIYNGSSTDLFENKIKNKKFYFSFKNKNIFLKIIIFIFYFFQDPSDPLQHTNWKTFVASQNGIFRLQKLDYQLVLIEAHGIFARWLLFSRLRIHVSHRRWTVAWC